MRSRDDAEYVELVCEVASKYGEFCVICAKTELMGISERCKAIESAMREYFAAEDSLYEWLNGEPTSEHS